MLLQLHICHTLLFFVTNFIMCIVSNYFKKLLCLCLWGFLKEKNIRLGIFIIHCFFEVAVSFVKLHSF